MTTTPTPTSWSILAVSGPSPTPSPACSPGGKECIDDGIFRLCHDDGSWGADQPCPDGTLCDQGDCKTPPPGMQACFPGDSQCVPGMANMVLKCRAAGDGFDATACPAGTLCDSGACSGACGAVGGTLCATDPSNIQTCDGNILTTTACPSGQLCVTNGDGVDQCLAADCDPRTACAVCGDPALPSIDPGSTLSFCGATPLGFKWQPLVCPAPTGVCDPKGGGACTQGAAGALNATCAASVGAVCTPGQQRCAPNFLSTQTCDATGHWVTTLTCSAVADEFCMPDPTNSNAVLCGNEVCATGAAGACVVDAGVTKLRACDNTGHLKPANMLTVCAGLCVPSGSLTAAGLQPGSCQAQCQAGETQCVVAAGTSAIQACSNGVWSSASTPCQVDGGAATVSCVDSTDPDSGKKKAFCAVCTPGTHRCTNGGGAEDAGASLPFVETCGSDGNWGAPEKCALGFCRGTPGTASCRVSCVPGQTVCVGALLPAASPAPLNFGRRAALPCNADGSLPAAPTCPAGAGCCQPAGNERTSCRTDTAHNALGCVVCVGATTNESGLIDTRCTDTTGALQTGSNVICGDAEHVSLETCKEDNTWGPPASCGTDMTCLDPGFAGVNPTVHCAPCANGESGTDACTDDNLQSLGFSGCTDPLLNGGAGYGAASTTCVTAANDHCCHQACVVDPGQPAVCFPLEECS